MLSDVIIKANLLEQKGILVHQVNCQGVMGAGLAKQIRQLFPKAYNDYIIACKSNNTTHNTSNLLGKVYYSQVNNNQIIAHLFGQNYFGYKGVYTDYNALNKGFKNINSVAKKYNLPVYIPYKIGCGLAGGDWNKVQSIIKANLTDCEYYICKL